jgi:putative ABC transport system permease protein
MPEWTEHVRPRLAGLRLSPTREAEIIEELSQHLDQRYEELRASGTGDVEARRLAIDELCEPHTLAAHMRSLRQAHVPSPITPGAPDRFFLVGNLWQDVRYGCRGLLRQPAFTNVAVLTLALGIGAAAAIFSVIQNVLLDPAPYADVDRIAIMFIRDVKSGAGLGRNAFQIPEILEYQRQNSVFEDLTVGRRDDVLLRTGDGTEQYRGALVTPNTFQFLGVPALLGRVLVSADAEPDAPPVFVMGHSMWASRFNSDKGVVGRTFVLDGIATTCVGVMPPRFTKNGGDLWRPIALEHADAKMSRAYFYPQGKLKRGVTLEQATAEMEIIARRVAQQFPDNYPKEFKVSVVRWIDGQVQEFQTTLYTLFAAVGVLLLIACSSQRFRR